MQQDHAPGPESAERPSPGLRQRVESARHWSEQRVATFRSRYWLADFIFGLGERDREVAGSVIAAALAFRLFLVLVPWMVVVVGAVAAFTDLSDYGEDQVVEALGVAGIAADAVVESARITSGQVLLAFLLGSAALLWAAHWATKSLRTIHALAWGMPVRRWPHPFRATLLFVGALALATALSAAFQTGSQSPLLLRLVGGLGFALAFGGFWVLVSWLLPHPKLSWRFLLPGAGLVAAGILGLNIATFYFLWKVDSSSSLYGTLGLAIVILVWLYFSSRLIVAAAMLNERVRFDRTGLRQGRTLLGDGEDEPGDIRYSLVGASESEGTGEMADDIPAGGSPTTGGAGSGETADRPAASDAEAAAEPSAGAAADDARPVKKKHRRLRGWIAGILVIFAVLFAIVMAIAIWSHTLLFNTDTYVETVAPILEQPKVTRAMGEVVADKTIEAVELEQRLDNVLPSQIGFIATPLTDEVRDLLAENVTKLLRTDRAYRAWEWILRFSHEQLIAILRDESTTVKLVGDEVRLDLVPLVIAALGRLEEILPGVVVERAPLPELDPTASLEEQRKTLAEYLGKPVSDDFATITLFKGEQVESVQTAVRLFDLLIWVLVGVTAALVIAALLVSPRRLRTLIYLGIGAVVVVLVTRIAVDQIQGLIVANASGQGGPIIIEAVDSIFSSLRNAVIWLLVAGVIVAVIAYFASRPRWLAPAGRAIAVGSRRVWEAASVQATEQKGPALLWIQAHSDALRIGIGALAAALLLFTPISWGGSVALIVVAAVIILGITWIGRRPAGDQDAAP